jgi:DNA-binding transcriptional MocR family regulator
VARRSPTRSQASSVKLPSGLRLPSSRRLAEQLEVARNTVIRAYEALMVEGLIESRPSSGLFVTLTPRIEVQHPAPPPRCRYPVKGLSADAPRRAQLEAEKPFPHDRVFALARPSAPIDSVNPQWAKKGPFAMLMLDEGLARVTTELDLSDLRLRA